VGLFSNAQFALSSISKQCGDGATVHAEDFFAVFALLEFLILSQRRFRRIGPHQQRPLSIRLVRYILQLCRLAHTRVA